MTTRLRGLSPAELDELERLSLEVEQMDERLAALAKEIEEWQFGLLLPLVLGVILAVFLSPWWLLLGLVTAAIVARQCRLADEQYSCEQARTELIESSPLAQAYLA